jgi:hypothetical protein
VFADNLFALTAYAMKLRKPMIYGATRWLYIYADVTYFPLVCAYLSLNHIQPCGEDKNSLPIQEQSRSQYNFPFKGVLTEYIISNMYFKLTYCRQCWWLYVVSC